MYEIKIKLSSDNPINIHYNHALQSNLYQYIDKENHDYPGVKIFTFSRILPSEGTEFVYDNKNKTILIQDGYLVFRILLKDIAERVALGLKQHCFIDVYGVKLFVKNATINKIEHLESSTFYTISPICIKDKERHQYLNPLEDIKTFETAMEKSIINKAKRIGIQDDDIRVEIVEVSSVHMIQYAPKALFEGYNMSLKLKGSESLMNVAYCAGVGQKTGCGLGCLESF